MNFSDHKNGENLSFSRIFPFLPNFRLLLDNCKCKRVLRIESPLCDGSGYYRSSEHILDFKALALTYFR